jgi:hypothetical protein
VPTSGYLKFSGMGRREAYMNHKKIPMKHDKRIALVAHDNKKRDLVE